MVSWVFRERLRVLNRELEEEERGRRAEKGIRYVL